MGGGRVKLAKRGTQRKLIFSIRDRRGFSKARRVSLYCRRQRGDLIETFKILNGLENVEASKFFEMRQPGRTRWHTMKIFKPRSRLLTRQRFFSIRMIDLWNGFP